MISISNRYRKLATQWQQIRRHSWMVVLFFCTLLTISAIRVKEGKLIQGIEIVVTPLAEGDYLLNQDTVTNLLTRSFTKPLDQLFLAEVDLGRLEAVLARHPLVAEAEVMLDTDMELHISITQRNPLVRIISNNGQNYYLDQTGAKMPLSRGFTARVPVASGNIVAWSDDYLSRPEHQLYQLFALVKLFQSDDFLSALIEQIYYTNQGELVLAPKVGDQVIYLGRYDPAKTLERLNRLKVFYAKGLPYEGWKKYSSFDLRYEKQVVCQKK
ncbi:MAG: hypothetical protein HC821_00455 [Lewinella sp.]|nr:hypothetical protein [Lewinella sp.]